jgi:serine/threonine protein kinase
MNYVNGSNLDKLLFSKHLHEYKEARYVIAIQIVYNTIMQLLQMTLAKFVDIVLKITDAVNYMHSHIPIIIHQDLKPQNVLVSNYNHKLLIELLLGQL